MSLGLLSTRRRVAGIGASLALVSFALDANAGYRQLGRVDITMTDIGPGDTEPGVVGDANGAVFIAWVHNLSTSTQGSDLTSVRSLRWQPVADMRTAVVESTFSSGAQSLIVTRLAVTSSPSNGPLQVVAGVNGNGWSVVVSRPGDSNYDSVLPTTAFPLPPGVFVTDLSVPRSLRVASGGASLPIGLTLADVTMPTSQTTASFAALLTTGGATVNAGMTYPFAGPGERAMRSAYWLLDDGAFFRIDPSTVEVDRADGRMLAATAVPFSALRAAPAVTNVIDGQLYGVLRVFDRFSCYDQTHLDMPLDCGAAPNFATDIDADADLQYPSDVWFAASERSAGTLRLSGVAAGGSHLAGDVVSLDTTGLEACEHARIAAVPGETLMDNQHAVVVASCIVTGTTTRRIYAWTLERPAAPSTDAGTETDAEADASTTDAVANDDVPSTMADGAIRSIGYRGSGCACRTMRGGSSSRAPVLAMMLALVGSSARRRRRRSTAASIQ